MFEIGDKGIHYDDTTDGFEKYTIVAISNEKVVGKLNAPCYGETAIVLARGSHQNVVIKTEFERLTHLHRLSNGKVVVPLYCSAVVEQKAPDPKHTANGACTSYVAKWIHGFHSKTNKPQFNKLISQFGKEKTNLADQAREDIDALIELSGKIGIGDLQVMLEKDTGKLYLIDPGELVNSLTSSPFLTIWRDVLYGEKELKLVDDDTYDKKD